MRHCALFLLVATLCAMVVMEARADDDEEHDIGFCNPVGDDCSDRCAREGFKKGRCNWMVKCLCKERSVVNTVSGLLKKVTN